METITWDFLIPLVTSSRCLGRKIRYRYCSSRKRSHKSRKYTSASSKSLSESQIFGWRRRPFTLFLLNTSSELPFLVVKCPLNEAFELSSPSIRSKLPSLPLSIC
ncbi:hypothetical protein M5K25_007890 [Dendrobium thyrsiflorum]|uniref:Uncharacterized protein n=1 Tax=Dendrobium thyrsiflorum TaxID=117978 RepID=A0ABD0V783_DENTH